MRLFSAIQGAAEDDHRVNVHLHYPCISVLLPSLSKEVLAGRDRVSVEMHREAVFERVWRCTRRPRLSELRDALGGRDRASLEMHLETEIQ